MILAAVTRLRPDVDQLKSRPFEENEKWQKSVKERGMAMLFKKREKYPITSSERSTRSSRRSEGLYLFLRRLLNCT